MIWRIYDFFRCGLLLLLLGVILGGCAPYADPEVRTEPESRHDLAADQAYCSDYAARYGYINLGPMMGDQAQNQPDRQRRKQLFVLCMEDKGYHF